MDPIFPGDIHTEVLIFLLNPGLLGVTEVDTDQKRLLPLMTEFLGGVSLKDYKIIWKIEIRETKRKKYLIIIHNDTLIVISIKQTGIFEVKHKKFIDVVPIV